METENTRRQLVKDAVKAVTAVGIIVLIGLVLTAGIFGADYGMRKAQAQTKQQMEGILDGYGLTEEQKEELFQAILKRLKTLLESGEITVTGKLGEEECERIKEELKKELQEEFADRVSQESLRSIVDQIWETLAKQTAEREELLKQVTAVYEQYTEFNKEQLGELEKSVLEVQKEFLGRLDQEISSLKEKLSEQIRVHSKEIEALQNGQGGLEEQLQRETQERKVQYEETVSRIKELEALLAELKDGFLLQLAALEERVTQNEADIQAVFQLVSSGKRLLASAITDKGVETAEDASFEVMAENIRRMAEYQFKRGYDSAPAAISEFYLNLHYWDNSGPLHNCYFANYVTFHVEGAESVTIGSIRTTVESDRDPDFAELAVQVALDGNPCYTLQDTDNYTIPTNGASTMTLRMINIKGEERFWATAVVRDLRLNQKQSRMAQAAFLFRMQRDEAVLEPEFADSGILITDCEGREVEAEEVWEQEKTEVTEAVEIEDQTDAEERVAKNVSEDFPGKTEEIAEEAEEKAGATEEKTETAMQKSEEPEDKTGAGENSVSGNG